MFDQEGSAIRFEWGPTGIKRAAARGDIIIVVDVLRFSSAVTIATAYGATLYPHPLNEDARDYAARLGLPLIHGGLASAEEARSLAPSSFGPDDAGRSYVVSSANGAACADYTDGASAVIAGALLNATATAEQAMALHAGSNAVITVIACGERWAADESVVDQLRPCLEDYLGAGAILSAMRGHSSPEAQVCAAAFQASRSNLEQILWECGSGRELRERGQGEDVAYCARVDATSAVPILRDGGFVAEG